MKATANYVPALLAALVFLLGGMLLVGLALVMGAGALAALLTGAPIHAQETIFLIAFGCEALVLFAAAFVAFQKFLQRATAEREVSIRTPAWLLVVVILVAAAVLGIGYSLEDNQSFDWWVLPLLTVPAIVLPLAVLLGLGARRLRLGTRWQAWSVLGLSMTLAPLLLFALEVAVAVFILIGVVAYVMTQPELAAQLQALSQQLMVLGPNSEAAVELIGPLLTRPAVMVIALLYIAALVPAIEEVLKPLGVWLLGRSLSPAQGFALGALSGAGYALIETVGVSGQQSTEWASLLASRIGTGLLHITTSALMGSAIVLALRERRYTRLLGTYMLAVFLHGLWNALAMAFTFSALAEVFEQPGRLGTLQPAIVISMVGLALGLFTLLLLSNRRWRKEVQTSRLETPIPGAAETDEINSAGPS